jgi:hypothetical protein
MATRQVTNQKSCEALNGTGVVVTLNNTDAQYLADFAEGDLVTADPSGQTGTIDSVDYEGNSFKVVPVQLNRTFNSGLYGYLAAGQTVTVTY